jgi:hypothetical protein
MHCLFRLAVVFPALALLVPALAAPPEKLPEDPKERGKLLALEYLVGKVTAVDGEGEDKTFTVVVYHHESVKNAKTAAKIEDLKKQAQNTGDVNAVKNLLLQIEDAKDNLYEMKDVPYEFNLKGGKDLIVRRLKPPTKESEDGKPIKLPPEELQKLRGDNPKIPGYQAELKDVDKDVFVRFYLDRSKIRLPSPTKKDDADEAVTYPTKMVVIVPTPENGGKEVPKELRQKPAVRAKFMDAPYLEGKLVKAELDDEKGLVVEVEDKVKVPNQQQAKRLKSILRQLQAAGKDTNKIRQLLDQKKDAESKLDDLKEVPYDFPLEYKKDELKVRLHTLPKLDENGKKIKYTPDEIKERKGDDPKLPGYTADLKDLTQDAIVRVHIDRAKLREALKKKLEEDEVLHYPVAVIEIMPSEEKPKEKEKDKK